MINVGSDFSGVGAFNQALKRLEIDYNEIFACDWNKYSRQTFALNYGEPAYFPMDVYEREIPKESLDIYMTSPPCQAFSLAGKRKGEEDDRGVLFYNSHEFITKNKPRYFIFENVKGLLSDDGGKTFQRWIDFLGGKSVNGNPVIFPLEEATPYHVYYQVLNAKNYGIPQNRERIFIIGVRDDADNDFSFPKPFHLVKRLKDVLENEVDEKYFLSDKMLNHLQNHPRSQDFINKDTENVNCITANYAKQSSDLQYLKIGAIRGRNPEVGQPIKQTLEINETGMCNSLTTVQKDNVVVIGFERTEEAKIKRKQSIANGKDTGSFSDRQMITKEQDFADTLLASPNPQKEGLIMIHSNTAKGYDTAEEEEDSINFSVPSSETRRGRIGKGVSQTLDTQCNQGIATRQLSKQEVQNCKPVQIGQSDKTFAAQNGTLIGKEGQDAFTIRASQPNGVFTQQRIRRLTPRECMRLMDFPETFKWDVSDTQAYKQAGNSICVGVLAEIIDKLKL